MGAVRRPGNRDRELEVIAVDAGAGRGAFLPVMQAMQGQLMAQLHTSQAPVQPTPQPGENDADEA